MTQPEPKVYFLYIGDAVKIGHTTNIARRLTEFRTASAEDISIIITFPGGRELEKRIHKLFASLRISNEFFRFDYPLRHFVDLVETKSIDAAMQWADEREQALERIRNRLPGEAKKISDRNYRRVLDDRFRQRAESVPRRTRVSRGANT